MKLTGKSKLILEEDETVMMKMAKEQEHPAKAAGEKKGKKSRGAVAFDLDEEDERLFEVLRGLRGEIARKEGVPPYIVFSDKSLVHMCVIRPVDKNEMLSVSGVGEFKFEKYGEQFLQCIARFNREIRIFSERWPKILEEGDPYYNPNLTLRKSNFALRDLKKEAIGEPYKLEI